MSQVQPDPEEVRHPDPQVEWVRSTYEEALRKRLEAEEPQRPDLADFVELLVSVLKVLSTTPPPRQHEGAENSNPSGLSITDPVDRALQVQSSKTLADSPDLEENDATAAYRFAEQLLQDGDPDASLETVKHPALALTLVLMLHAMRASEGSRTRQDHVAAVEQLKRHSVDTLKHQIEKYGLDESDIADITTRSCTAPFKGEEDPALGHPFLKRLKRQLRYSAKSQRVGSHYKTQRRRTFLYRDAESEGNEADSHSTAGKFKDFPSLGDLQPSAEDRLTIEAVRQQLTPDERELFNIAVEVTGEDLLYDGKPKQTVIARRWLQRHPDENRSEKTIKRRWAKLSTKLADIPEAHEVLSDL